MASLEDEVDVFNITDDTESQLQEQNLKLKNQFDTITEEFAAFKDMHSDHLSYVQTLEELNEMRADEIEHLKTESKKRDAELKRTKKALETLIQSGGGELNNELFQVYVNFAKKFMKKGCTAKIHGTGKDYDGQDVVINGKIKKDKQRYPVVMINSNRKKKRVNVKPFNLLPTLTKNGQPVIQPIPQAKKDMADCCVICFDKPMTHAILPCGHLCLCRSPSCQRGIGRRCPICRQYFNEIKRVFLCENAFTTDVFE